MSVRIENLRHKQEYSVDYWMTISRGELSEAVQAYDDLSSAYDDLASAYSDLASSVDRRVQEAVEAERGEIANSIRESVRLIREKAERTKNRPDRIAERERARTIEMIAEEVEQRGPATDPKTISRGG